MERTALVIGATGVTGTPMVEELLLAGWPVHAVSRRVPMVRSGVPVQRLHHVPVDLTDAAASRTALGALTDVTHLFYCGNDPNPEVRLALMQNVIDTVERLAPGFRASVIGRSALSPLDPTYVVSISSAAPAAARR